MVRGILDECWHGSRCILHYHARRPDEYQRGYRHLPDWPRRGGGEAFKCKQNLGCHEIAHLQETRRVDILMTPPCYFPILRFCKDSFLITRRLPQSQPPTYSIYAVQRRVRSDYRKRYNIVPST